MCSHPSGERCGTTWSGTGFLAFKGVLEVGANSCAGCHTRAMPDGSFLEGAQGNLVGLLAASKLRTSAPAVPQIRDNEWVLFGAPWVTKKEEFEKSITLEELIRRHEAAAQSRAVHARQGTSHTYPPRIPSLIGVQDLRYLDATGLQRHRSIGDLMRYAIINTGLDTIAHFGDFQPSAKGSQFSGERGTRFSDEQLYALALYIYSLKPPPNPNPLDGSARRGQLIFQQQGCIGCHTLPLYPAPSFKVPGDLRETDDILDVSVGTDPTLALQTRRGTGFYKVPSLRGVWYRNGFGHNGQAYTLEEWLDPARLRDDYVPKGFHLGPGPIKGHEFGLGLTPGDRQDLIAISEDVIDAPHNEFPRLPPKRSRRCSRRLILPRECETAFLENDRAGSGSASQ